MAPAALRDKSQLSDATEGVTRHDNVGRLLLPAACYTEWRATNFRASASCDRVVPCAMKQADDTRDRHVRRLASDRTAVISSIFLLALGKYGPFERRRAVPTTVAFAAVPGESVPMRLVKQAAGHNSGLPPAGPLQHQQTTVVRTPPRPFKGPEHLRPLLGRCFSQSTAGYRYTLCPFDNVTQAEESARWNAYNGVLGVWQGWSAANGSLTAMHYTHGDSCGSLNRSVEVRLTCAPQPSLVSVSEPERCRYAMELAVPTVCHEDALLVWPALGQPQWQQRWHLAHSRHHSGETTAQACLLTCHFLCWFQSSRVFLSVPYCATQGHDAELAQILWEAGLGVAPTTVARPAWADLAPQCHTVYQELA
ncbi:hypothetical protein HPB48_011407 [Haemaphysalis longicornis]|uniref:MRH domain-containing protein n=1 Tax=Haemaphysalis longicornis TaxID=44386 RepID=A0A9J6FQM7_HAELO|nr:hypothetical protein HPB48_011407 [Haemaphysalis longicornis]